MDDHLYFVHDVASDGIRLQIEFQPRANYSLVLSGIPFIRAVVVHNETGEVLPAIQLKARLDVVGYPKPVTWYREISGPHAPGSVVRLDRPTDFAEFLSILAETAESAQARLEIRARNPAAPGAEAQVIANVEVSAYNEFLNWPELHASIATFVQPNTRSVTAILRSASDFLMAHTGDGSLAGYQGGPDRARQIGAAIYEALRSRQISYINPPASFERTGQKVRTTEQVLVDRFGTCIDLSVLYAACLEASGLYSTIFITRNHAFGGFYTQEIFGEATTIVEVNSLANLIEIGIVAPVELTGLNPGTNLAFGQAHQAGLDYFTRKLDYVTSMVDIAKARFDRILPMPHFGSTNDPVSDQQHLEAERPFVTHSSFDSILLERQEEVRGIRDARDDSPPRFRNWKRDLLDLSLRNPLLNMPRSQKVMDLVVPEGMLAEVDDLVHSGKSLRLTPADALDAMHLARGIRSAGELDGRGC